LPAFGHGRPKVPVKSLAGGTPAPPFFMFTRGGRQLRSRASKTQRVRSITGTPCQFLSTPLFMGLWCQGARPARTRQEAERYRQGPQFFPHRGVGQSLDWSHKPRQPGATPGSATKFPLLFRSVPLLSTVECLWLQHFRGGPASVTREPS